MAGLSCGGHGGRPLRTRFGPRYGQRGAYADDYRARNRAHHLAGQYPSDKASVDAMKPFAHLGLVPGARRNLSVPTHVAVSHRPAPPQKTCVPADADVPAWWIARSGQAGCWAPRSI